MDGRAEILRTLKELGQDLERLFNKRATITHQIERLQMLMDYVAREDPEYAAYVERVGKEHASDIVVFWLGFDELQHCMAYAAAGTEDDDNAARIEELQRRLGLPK